MPFLSIHNLSIFSIHYSPLSERLEFIQLISSKLEAPIDIVTEQSVSFASSSFQDSIDYSLLRSSVEFISDYLLLHFLFLSCGNDIAKLDKRLYLQNLTFPYANQDFFARQAISSYSKANYELSCQHYLAISSFLQSKNELCLILEDDSLLLADINALNYLLSNLQPFYDNIPLFVDVSNSLGLIALYNHRSTSTACNLSLVPVLPGQTRCASAYIINKLAAAEILKNNNFVLPIDWHLSYCLRQRLVATFWSSPGLFLQGSQTDLFVSNQDQRNT